MLHRTIFKGDDGNSFTTSAPRHLDRHGLRGTENGPPKGGL